MSSTLEFTLKITQEAAMEGVLVVEAEGSLHGEKVGPVLFSYEPSNPAKIATLEIATMARDAYGRLNELTLTEV